LTFVSNLVSDVINEIRKLKECKIILDYVLMKILYFFLSKFDFNLKTKFEK